MNRRAFTLIELLIVVLIIAILALIALPNLMEAFTRTRCSRVKEDMRTIAMAIDVYNIDRNCYPPGWMTNEPNGTSSFQYWVSTPIAYITKVPQDIFWPSENRHSYGYINFDLVIPQWFAIPDPNKYVIDTSSIHLAAMYAGSYCIYSIGPDGVPENKVGITERHRFRDYDPTNGSVSAGNLFRTKVNPSVLGVHPYFYIDP